MYSVAHLGIRGTAGGDRHELDIPRQRRLRLDLERYRQLKMKILERDGWKCQPCGRRDQLQTSALRASTAAIPFQWCSSRLLVEACRALAADHMSRAQPGGTAVFAQGSPSVVLPNIRFS
jgi:hypothetical protein